MDNMDYVDYCQKPHVMTCLATSCKTKCRHFKPMKRSKVDQFAMDVANIYAKDGDDAEWELFVKSSQAMARLLLHDMGITITEDVAHAMIDRMKNEN